jgi:ATP-dependent protease ClpP protease subunit
MNQQDTQELFITSEETTQTKYRVYLTEEIREPFHYNSLIDILDTADNSNIVEYRINSEGGDLASAISIATAHFETGATTSAMIEGQCYSAATLIAFSCEFIRIKPFTSFLFHSARGSIGYVADSVSKGYSEMQHKIMTHLFATIYGMILTPNEIESMINTDKHFWLTADEMMERLDNSPAYQSLGNGLYQRVMPEDVKDPDDYKAKLN